MYLQCIDIVSRSLTSKEVVWSIAIVVHEFVNKRDLPTRLTLVVSDGLFSGIECCLGNSYMYVLHISHDKLTSLVGFV